MKKMFIIGLIVYILICNGCTATNVQPQNTVTCDICNINPAIAWCETCNKNICTDCSRADGNKCVCSKCIEEVNNNDE